MRRFWRHLEEAEERGAPRSTRAPLYPLARNDFEILSQSENLDGFRKDVWAPVVSPKRARAPMVQDQGDVGSRRAVPSGSDKRRFNPQGKDRSSTIYGTEAQVLASKVFSMAQHVYPCIQRKARREVMFALGHSGRAYRKKRRWTETSNIEC